MVACPFSFYLLLEYSLWESPNLSVRLFLFEWERISYLLLFPYEVRHVGLLVPLGVAMFRNTFVVHSIETVSVGPHEINGILDVEIRQRLGEIVECDIVALHHDDFPVALAKGPA